MKRSIVLLSFLSSAILSTTQLPAIGMEDNDQIPSILGKRKRTEDLSKRMDSLSLKSEKKSFTKDVKNIFNNYQYDTDKTVIRGLVEQLYNQQNELDEDLIKDGILNNDECVVLFDIAKELNLPIVFGTDSHGISLFSIHKGQSIIESIIEIEFNGLRTPDEEKLTRFFISDHFTSLREIDLQHNELIEVGLSNLPDLRWLNLSYNNLPHHKLRLQKEINKNKKA